MHMSGFWETCYHGTEEGSNINEVTIMSSFQCSRCGKPFKGESGLAWHLERAHARAGSPENVPSGFVPCSSAASEFIKQVVAKTGLPAPEALDVLIAAAINDEYMEPMLDTWDPAKSGSENAPWWLPLSVLTPSGQRITL